jgi:hypothetical protein
MTRTTTLPAGASAFWRRWGGKPYLAAPALLRAQTAVTFAVPNPSALTWLPYWVAVGEGYFAEEGSTCGWKRSTARRRCCRRCLPARHRSAHRDRGRRWAQVRAAWT